MLSKTKIFVTSFLCVFGRFLFKNGGRSAAKFSGQSIFSTAGFVLLYRYFAEVLAGFNGDAQGRGLYL
jgi:hypothetical protein